MSDDSNVVTDTPTGVRCHKPQDSLFTSSSGYTNYRGLLNLCIILLVLSNARVALENILKYGILVDPFAIARVISDPTFVPCVQLFIGLWVMAFVSLMIEKILSTGFLSETVAKILITGHTGAVVFVPAYVVYVGNCQLSGAVAVLSFASVTFLKLISYHMVNAWCRVASHGSSKSKKNYSAKVNNNNSASDLNTKTDGEDSKPLVRYPDNLNVRDLIYFMLVPTLCYELNFPRTSHIRKRFVTRRAIEAIFLSQLMMGLVQQWLFPTIINSAAPLKEMNYLKMCERLLKLAVCFLIPSNTTKTLTCIVHRSRITSFGSLDSTGSSIPCLTYGQKSSDLLIGSSIWTGGE